MASAKDDRLFEVHEPYSGRLFARRRRYSRGCGRAVDAAARAFPGWSETAPAERARLFLKAAEIVRRRRTEIAEVLARETGSTISFSTFQQDLVAATLEQVAGWVYLPKGEVLETNLPGTHSIGVRRSLGVVACFTPWNGANILSFSRRRFRWPRSSSRAARARPVPAPTSSMRATSPRWRPGPTSAPQRRCRSASGGPESEPEQPRPSARKDGPAGNGEIFTGGTKQHDAEKQINDASAYIRSLAQLRGRNVEWAEKAVREAVSLSAEEALHSKSSIMSRADVSDLLDQAQGTRVSVGG